MRQYRFTLILASDPTEAQIDRLYGVFQGAVLSGVQAGIPYLDCTIAAASFEEAVRHVLKPVRAEGISVERVEVDSDSLSTLEAA